MKKVVGKYDSIPTTCIRRQNNIAMVEAHMKYKNKYDNNDNENHKENNNNRSSINNALSSLSTIKNKEEEKNQGTTTIIIIEQKRLSGHSCACLVNIQRTKWMIAELMDISYECVTLAYRLQNIFDSALFDDDDDDDVDQQTTTT